MEQARYKAAAPDRVRAQLAGVQHGGVLIGVLIGVLLVALAGSASGNGRPGSMRSWTIGGRTASAVAPVGMAVTGPVGPRGRCGPDLILGLVALEAIALAAYHRRTGRGIAAGDLISNLLSGVCLMLALRAALVNAWWGWIALWLFASLLTHVLDLRRRWRE